MAHATNDINALTRLAGGGSHVCGGCLYHSAGDFADYAL